MNIVIDEDVLKNTAECNKSFSCLFHEKNGICKVEYCVGGEVLFVRAKNRKHCNYRKSFGKHFICTCPTRKKIYELYKI